MGSIVVGTCPGHHPQPIGQNRVLQFERPGPPPPLRGIIALSM